MRASLLILLFSVVILLVSVTTMIQAITESCNNEKLLTVAAAVFALSLCSTITSILLLIGGAVAYS